MVTNQRIPTSPEGIVSAITGESVPGTDGQNAIPLISIVLTISYQIVQNPTPGQLRNFTNGGPYSQSVSNIEDNIIAGNGRGQGPGGAQGQTRSEPVPNAEIYIEQNNSAPLPKKTK
jgi:hypothetical protein